MGQWRNRLFISRVLLGWFFDINNELIGRGFVSFLFYRAALKRYYLLESKTNLPLYSWLLLALIPGLIIFFIALSDPHQTYGFVQNYVRWIEAILFLGLQSLAFFLAFRTKKDNQKVCKN